MRSFFKALFYIVGVVCIIIIALIIIGVIMDASSGFPSDSYSRLVEDSDEHILGVKYGSPSSYPDITYANAFGNFFGSPKWKYFRGSTDNSSKVYDVVEFTGSCMYRDVEVDARIQFTISDDGETFEATFLSFNDIPQNNILLNALIEKAFSEYQEQQKMSSQELKPVG